MSLLSNIKSSLKSFMSPIGLKGLVLGPLDCAMDVLWMVTNHRHHLRSHHSSVLLSWKYSKSKLWQSVVASMCLSLWVLTMFASGESKRAPQGTFKGFFKVFTVLIHILAFPRIKPVSFYSDNHTGVGPVPQQSFMPSNTLTFNHEWLHQILAPCHTSSEKDKSCLRFGWPHLPCETKPVCS